MVCIVLSLVFMPRRYYVPITSDPERAEYGLNENSRKKRNRTTRVILFGLALLSLSWLFDAIVDAHFEHSELATQFFSPEPKELLLRLFFLGSQIAFIVYILILFKRREDLERDLAAALQLSDREKTRSEAILEAFGDGISIQDLDLRIIYQNARHREMMGEHRGEFCYTAYHKRDDVCPDCHVLESFRDGLVHRRETGSEHSSRGHIDVEVVSTPLRDTEGKIFAGIEAVRDITERKCAEATIRRISSDLEGRTRELSAANVDLEAFGSTLAHDIRSYLARIATAVEILQQLDGEALGANGRYCVETIAAASDGMDQLIESIMILSRISHREVHCQTVDLSTIAGEIAVTLQQSAPERDAIFTITPGLVAQGDPGLLRIALENLMSNAWKYSRNAHPACIDFSSYVEGGQHFYCVADNGIGFDMTDVERLFRPFGRLSGGRAFPGVGIGLTTVKRIILRHGGEVHVNASPGNGARFAFSLEG